MSKIGAPKSEIFEISDSVSLEPVHRDVFSYWQSKCRDGRLPSRADIDPLEIPNVLPSMLLLDVDSSEKKPNFRFRLFGTALVERAGVDLTGLTFEDAFPKDQQQEYFVEAAHRLLREKKPLGFTGHSMIEGFDYIRIAGLLLPLASDGETVDVIIGVNLRQTIPNH